MKKKSLLIQLILTIFLFSSVSAFTDISDSLINTTGNLYSNWTNSTSDICIVGGKCLSKVLISYTEDDPFWSGNYSDFLLVKALNDSGLVKDWSYLTSTIDLSNYYNITQIDINFSNYYTKSEIDINLSNYVPYTGATSDVNLGANNLIIDTDVLYVDSTNNRVGIGTSSPTGKLVINDSSTIPLTIYGNGANFFNMYKNGISSSSAFFKISSGTSSAAVFAPIFWAKGNSASYPGTWFLADTTTDTGTMPVTVFTSRYNNGAVSTRPLFSFTNFAPSAFGGTDIMTMLANGNVGIGTATPQNKLNVIGEVNATQYIVNASIGYSGTCVNVTYSGGIAVSCND